jgi:N-acetylglucosamine-6-phosphate deacetylase
MTLEGRWVFDTPSEEPAGSVEAVRLEITNGSVARVEIIESTDSDRYLAPGFIDAQVNGYRGSDYSLDTLDVDHIRNISIDLARSGATRHIATVVTSPQERILRNLALIARSAADESDLQGAIPGIHLEGPYISDEDGPRGAHDRAFARDPDVRELDEWIDASRGLLNVVTLAPERPGAVEFIEALRDRGIVAAIGHTGASPEQIRNAVRAGATLSTHLGNGSHAMLPRLKNYLWEQLAADELSMGLICDGFHVPEPVVKCFARIKGLERILLVSDVALYGGAKPGRYRWGAVEVEVYPDGHLGVADTPYLAGAGHTLAWGVPRFIEFTGAGLDETVRLCTSNPARLFGLPFDETRPVVGRPADFVQFRYRSGAESLAVERVARALFTL